MRNISGRRTPTHSNWSRSTNSRRRIWYKNTRLSSSLYKPVNLRLARRANLRLARRGQDRVSNRTTLCEDRDCSLKLFAARRLLPSRKRYSCISLLRNPQALQIDKAENAGQSGLGSLARLSCFVLQCEFLCRVYLAQTTNLPYPKAEADYHQANEDAKQGSRPGLERSRP